MLNVPESADAPGRIPRHIDELLEQCLLMGGSDLHLAGAAAPTARVNGGLVQIDGFSVLTPDVIERLVFSILSERKIADFVSEMELDTSYSIPGRSRFRMNVFRQRGSVGAVLRTIPFTIPAFYSLHLPGVIRSFAELPRGLVLVTGPTGSGKSTTLASLLDIINRWPARCSRARGSAWWTMDQNLAELVRARRISMVTALEHASNSDDLRTLLGLVT